jgi:hypothetical protein
LQSRTSARDRNLSPQPSHGLSPPMKPERREDRQQPTLSSSTGWLRCTDKSVLIKRGVKIGRPSRYSGETWTITVACSAHGLRNQSLCRHWCIWPRSPTLHVVQISTFRIREGSSSEHYSSVLRSARPCPVFGRPLRTRTRCPKCPPTFLAKYPKAPGGLFGRANLPRR